jgi:type IV pilus assembly protein PilV
MAGLQATGLRNNNNAYHRTQATVIALDILERMRGNRAAAANGDYELAMNDNAPASPSTQAEWDLFLWLDNIEDKLQNAGDGQVTCALVAPPSTRFVECTVTVQWTEIQDKAQGAADNTQFIMSTRL